MKKSVNNITGTKKNTVLFLVEGDSDQHALENSIQELFDTLDPKYRIVFAQQKHRAEPDEGADDESTIIESEDDNLGYGFDDYTEGTEDENDEYGGDITTSYGVWPRNIEHEISQRFFVPIINKENLYAKQLLQVIQLVDLDGAYLSEERLVPFAPERKDRSKFYYNTDRLLIEGDPGKISKRNYHKRKNIDYLVSRETIHIQGKEVPYAIYYFTSNLDHVIHQNANLEGSKVSAADAFAAQFYDNLPGFINFFDKFDSGEFCGLGYEESWALVRDMTCARSIMPGTNLYLLLRELRDKVFPLPR